MRFPNLKKAVEMYYSKPEITTSDIIDLWSCSRATARKLKLEALDKMVENNEICLMSNTVLTKTAFEAWGINIDDCIERLTMLYKLKRVYK